MIVQCLAFIVYDGNGNTLTKADASGTTTYNWDFENRLSSVVLPNSGGTVTFKYDPFGRRIQKSSFGGTTNYLYDSANSLQEVDQSGTIQARYAQAPGIDELLAEFRQGTLGYYDQDGIRSVTSVNASTGTTSDSYTYDTFGNSYAPANLLTNSFRYTGRDFDPETGLQYYRARYYDSSTGTFISEDPIGFKGGINFYKYVDNNPVNWRDASGLTKWHCWYVDIMFGKKGVAVGGFRVRCWASCFHGVSTAVTLNLYGFGVALDPLPASITSVFDVEIEDYSWEPNPRLLRGSWDYSTVGIAAGWGWSFSQLRIGQAMSKFSGASQSGIDIGGRLLCRMEQYTIDRGEEVLRLPAAKSLCGPMTCAKVPRAEGISSLIR